MSDEQQEPADVSAQPEQFSTDNQPPAGTKPSADNKLVAGVLGILLGGFGIHKFILGYQKEGIIMLVVSLATCGFGYAVTGIIGLIEGIIYLTKTDEEFVQTYVVNKKAWF